MTDALKKAIDDHGAALREMRAGEERLVEMHSAAFKFGWLQIAEDLDWMRRTIRSGRQNARAAFDAYVKAAEQGDG